MSQEIITQSWGTRIKNAFFGIIFGVLLIAFSCYYIFWNENTSIHTAHSLQQTEQVLISVPATPMDPNNNMKVVYLNGKATTTQTLTDNFLNVSANALRLFRTVKMYQWQEHEQTTSHDNRGGSQTETKTYSYDKTWNGNLIDSNRFHDQSGHTNPDHMPLTSQNYQADTITVGDFNLSSDLASQLSNETPVNLAQVDAASLQNKFSKPVEHEGDGLYVGTNPQQPQIGDLRIKVTEILPQTVSVIAQQNAHTLQPYLAPAGKFVGILSMGEVAPHDMIHHAEEQNAIQTWLIRGATLLAMIIGISLLMQPVVILADIIPFLGSVVGFGTGMIGLVLGLAIWSILTAVAWFAVRPLMSVGLVIVAAFVCYYLYAARQKKRATTPPR